MVVLLGDTITYPETSLILAQNYYRFALVEFCYLF
jgi:hypothetical protein